jgi:hypothetical protein
MKQQNENQKDTDMHLLDKLSVGAVMRSGFLTNLIKRTNDEYSR